MDLQSESCYICKNALHYTGEDGSDSDQTVVRTICNHLFHQKCYTNWIKSDRNHCPVCQRKTLWDATTPAPEYNICQAALNAIADSEEGQMYHNGARTAGAQAQQTSKEGKDNRQIESHTWWESTGKPDDQTPVRKLCQHSWQESKFWEKEGETLTCRKCGDPGAALGKKE